MTKLKRWVIGLCVGIVIFGAGYGLRMWHESDRRFEIWESGQEHVLQIIQEESLKGFDFSIRVGDKRVEFQPMEGGTVRMKRRSR